MVIEISEGKKHKVIEFPQYFEAKGFRRCYTKAQFDYLTSEDYETPRMYFDYKKKLIYFHEWCEPALTGDCDYAWSSPYDYKKKVFVIWSN